MIPQSCFRGAKREGEPSTSEKSTPTSKLLPFQNVQYGVRIDRKIDTGNIETDFIL